MPLHIVERMQKVPMMEALREAGHHLLEYWHDPRLLLVNRRREDRCSGPWDEEHQCCRVACHEAPERPDPSFAEQFLN